MRGSLAEIEFTDWLHWLTNQSLGSCWVHLPVDNSAPCARIAGARCHVSYLCGCWRPMLRFSYLLRKHFTRRVISWAKNSAVFLHASSGKSENNVEEANLFASASRRTKILRVRLSKEVPELLHDRLSFTGLNRTLHCCRGFRGHAT